MSWAMISALKGGTPSLCYAAWKRHMTHMSAVTLTRGTQAQCRPKPHHLEPCCCL